MLTDKIKLALAAVTACLLLATGFYLGSLAGRVEAATAKKELADYKSDQEAASARLSEIRAKETQLRYTRAAEDAQAQAQEAQRIEDQLRKQADQERQNYEKTIADLRDGNKRLRERFKCPRSADSVPNAGTDTRGSENSGAGGLSEQDGGFLIGESARADALAVRFNRCAARLQLITEKFTPPLPPTSPR